ncbi:hypothetical protein ANRL1_01468 [Anaerolineae bacterium]|nr:hypothetical protein ANRL1_01468 [Anaerolineae bacterium]
MKKEKHDKKLNKRVVRQMVRGFKTVNRFTDAEERATAARLTPKQARAMFIELCQAWERGGARAGGDMKAVERLRIAETVRAQRPFAEIARRMKRR